MTKKRLLALLIALLMMISLAAFAEIQTEETQEPKPNEHFFASLKLSYIDGSPFDTSVFIGKPVLLNIWATWCPPCIGEMPHLNELAKEYEDKINIIGLHAEGLTIDGQGELIANEETNTLALKLQEDMGLTFPLINPDQTLFVLMNVPDYGLNVSVLPTTWLIDEEGYIRSIIESSYDKEGWTDIIERFLTDLETPQEEGNENNGQG